MAEAKRKSARRFEQLNEIIDEIAPKLPGPSHVAVLLCCFRHGRGAGYFRVSTARLARSTTLQHRRVRYVMDELERMGVIEMITEHKGPIPRTYRIKLKGANGALQCHIKTKPAPRANGALRSS